MIEPQLYSIEKDALGYTQLLGKRNYKAGYTIRRTMCFSGGNPPCEMNLAYNPEGVLIGDGRLAYRLCLKMGIKPIPIPGHNICGIGFRELNQRWYGWSHRGMCDFGIGDIVKEGDCTNGSGWTKEYLEDHPEKDLSLPVGFEARTLDDAKRMAMAYSESIS